MNTILVVDDSPLVRDLINQVLSEKGITILEASNGREALDILKKIKPSLILLDIMMPEMDGISFMQEFVKIKGYENIPVIVLTALSERSLIDKIRAFGVKDVLFKPFSPAKLRTTIQQYLKQGKSKV